MTLRSIAEVEHWVSVNGVDELRKAVDQRQFAGPGQAMATAWLQKHDAQAVRLDDLDHRTAERKRDERATDAAERSASAAERSADASVTANRIAWLALLVALAALAMAAWPYINPAS